ncbi:MAG TPA: hypothetical protein VIQ62_04085 [Burkholderiales bacterium]
MKKAIAALFFLLTTLGYAYAQNAPDAPPTAFTEPASMTAVIVFLVVFFGSIVLFAYWVWHRSKKHKH